MAQVGGDSRFPVLDVWDDLAVPHRYLPGFAAANYENECKWVADKIRSFLGNDAQSRERLASKPGQLMHCIRLLGSAEDKVLPTFEDKKQIATQLWNLWALGRLTPTQRGRVCETLTGLLRKISFYHAPLIWVEQSARSSHVGKDRLLEFGKSLNWRVVYDRIWSRFQRSYCADVEFSCARRKTEVQSLVKLAAACRPFWDAIDVGESLEKLFNMEKPDLREGLIFYKIRILLLFCSSEFWYHCAQDGKLLRWWSYLGCRSASTYDSTFICFLSAAAKYGWATGQPCNRVMLPYVPIIFQIVSNALGVPVAQGVTLTLIKEHVPGELTVLLKKNLNVLRKLSKLIIYLLEPIEGPVDLAHPQAEGVKPPESVPCTPLVCGVAVGQSIWVYVTALAKVIFPLAHPSNAGRWSVPIGEFINAFTLEYTRRVGRERMSPLVTKASAGRQLNPPATPGGRRGEESGILSFRLGRREDARFVSLFLPTVLEGTHSKNLQISMAYEAALKRLCVLAPDLVLPTVTEKIFAALESVTETNQLLSTLRLLAPLAPLMIQRIPGVLPQLLTATLPAIDGTEPFKSVQCLTFYTTLLMHISCRDLSDDDITPEAIEEARQRIVRQMFPPAGTPSPYISFENYPPETVKSCTKVKAAARQCNTSGNEGGPYVIDTYGEATWEPARYAERVNAMRIATSFLPQWASTLFDQLLRLISCSTDAEKSKTRDTPMENYDRGLSAMTRFALYSIFADASSAEVRRFCSSFLDWLASNASPSATKLMCVVARAFVQARPEIAVGELLPKILSRFFVMGSTQPARKGVKEEGLEREDEEELASLGDTTSSAQLSEDSSFLPESDAAAGCREGRRRSIPNSERRLSMALISEEDRSRMASYGNDSVSASSVMGGGDKPAAQHLLRKTSLAAYPAKSMALEPSQEAAVLWFLNCLASLVRCSGAAAEHLSSHEVSLRGALLWAMNHPNEKIGEVGAKVARRVIESCCVTVTNNFRRSVHTGFPLYCGHNCLFEDIDRYLHTKGGPAQSKLITEVEWVTPSPASLAMARRFSALVIDFALKLLQRAMDMGRACVTQQNPSNLALLDIRDLRPSFLETHEPNGARGEGFPSGEDLCPSVPLAKLVNRALLYGTVVLWAVSPISPDERARVEAGFPLVMKGGETEEEAVSWGREVARCLSGICTRVARVFLGLDVLGEDPSFHVEACGPLIRLQGTEDSSVTQRLCVGLCECLLRHYSIGGVHAQSGTQAHLWVSLMPWLSVYHGTLHRSITQDVNCVAWDERQLAYWMVRLDRRREQHNGGQGPRSPLLALVTRLANHSYAVCRTTAQSLLNDALNCHYGARTKLCRMLVQDIADAAAGFIEQGVSGGKSGSSSPKSRSGSPPTRTAKHSPPGRSPNGEGDTSHRGREEASAVEEVWYARLTGASFVLTSTPNLRRVWSDLTLLKQALLALMKTFKAPIARDKVRQRLLKFMQALVGHREPVDHATSDFRHEIEEEVLRVLLDELHQSSTSKRCSAEGMPEAEGGEDEATATWKFQLAATAVLIIFNTANVVPSLQEEYAAWLLKAIDPKTYPPLLNTLAGFGLMQYLVRHMDGKGRLISSAIPSSVVKQIHDPALIRAIASSFVHAHHEACRTAAGTGANRPETAVHLVIDVLRLDRSWPFSRQGRLAKNFSIHNVVIQQIVLQFQMATVGLLHEHGEDPGKPRKDTDKIAAADRAPFLAAWLGQAAKCLAQPPGEPEHLVAGAEIIGGLIRGVLASTTEEPDQHLMAVKKELWDQLLPLYQRAYQSFDQALYADFLDALHFGVDLEGVASVLSKEEAMGVSPEEAIAPLIGLALAPVCETAEQLHNACLRVLSGCGSFTAASASSSLELCKQLRALAVAVAHARWAASQMVLALNEPLRALLAHPYKQVRLETAKVCYDVIGVAADPFAPPTFRKLAEVLLHSMAARIPILETHITTTAAQARDLEAERAPELREAESMFYNLSLIFGSSIADFIQDYVIQMLPLCCAVIKHPDKDVAGYGFSALMHYAVSAAGVPHPETLLQSPDSQSMTRRSRSPIEFNSCIVKHMMQHQNSNSWKVRHTIVKLAELIGFRMRLCLHGTPNFSWLVEICIRALSDPQTEVRNQAKATLAGLSLTLTDQECELYTEKFSKLAGPPLAMTEKPSLEAVGGVSGLIALIRSAPYHVPRWMPSTLTLLARYGHSRAPDTVKRQVQEALQEFFRTHQDAWRQSHVQHFSPEQLDILETYKGRPVYFS